MRKTNENLTLMKDADMKLYKPYMVAIAKEKRYIIMRSADGGIHMMVDYDGATLNGCAYRKTKGLKKPELMREASNADIRKYGRPVLKPKA